MICGRASSRLRTALVVSLLPFLALGVWRPGEAQPSEGQPAAIPMRDGVVLRAESTMTVRSSTGWITTSAASADRS
jgi:hypothetical protein